MILACRINPELDKCVAGLVERYRELLALYDRGISPFAPGYQPLPQAIAVLRAMRLLAAMSLTDYRTPIPEGAGLPIPLVEGSKGIADIASGLTTLALSSKKEETAGAIVSLGIARPDIASWAVRLNGYLPYLSAPHAAWACVQVADIFRSMRYERKALFYAGHALSWGEGGEAQPHGTRHLLSALIAQAQGLGCFGAPASQEGGGTADGTPAFSARGWIRLQVAALERILLCAAKARVSESITAIGPYPAVVCASLLLSRFHPLYPAHAQRRLYAALESAVDAISPGRPEDVPSGVSLGSLALIR